MIIKDLDYHKKGLHDVTEQIKKLRKDLGLPKRSSDDIILHKLLQSYKYWATRTKTGKNINRVKYSRKRIKTFHRLLLCKTVHQTIIVMLIKQKSEKGELK